MSAFRTGKVKQTIAIRAKQSSKRFPCGENLRAFTNWS